jgi:hypothetical protein
MNIVKIDNIEQLPDRIAAIESHIAAYLVRGKVEVVVQKQKRSLDQNAKMWPMLSDVSKQVDWYGEKLSPEDWKNVFTASLRKQRAVPGIDGGFVVLGLSTKNLNKEEFSDLIEIIYAFGSEKEVRWSERAMGFYEELQK